MTISDTIFEKMRFSIVPKMVFIGFLVFLSIIPSALILFLVEERESTRFDAIEEVSDKWASMQTITGPVVTVPYTNGTKREYAYFLPDTLEITGDLSTEIRKRGIYEVPVYTTALNIKGTFPKIDFINLGVSEKNILWSESIITVGLDDMRGIQEEVAFIWDAKTAKMEAMAAGELVEKGLGIHLNSLNTNQDAHSFEMALTLKGSKDLAFIPVGSTTNVQLNANWKDPSFNGTFLPDDYELTTEGFTAQWSVLSLNRSYPQAWKGNNYSFYDSAFGVELFTPIDAYQKVTRSVKYMILFVFLTFSTYFFIEVLNRKRIHPMQYLLIGFALLLFYVLLLSISEHINFGIAYLIATIGIVGLITFYSHNILQNKKLTCTIGSFLTILYVVLYALLQSSDYALLMGSLLLFVLLGTVMYITRKVDWYNLKGT